MCGVVVTHEKGKVLSIQGDKHDPLSRGHICPKAVALQDIHDDPDRLRYPMLKTPQGWERISWENAFNEAASRLRTIQAKHGKNAVGMYTGNPTIHNLGSMITIAPLMAAVGTKNRFSATSVDQLAPMLVAMKMFGSHVLLPVPDIDRTDYFLCIGGNPLASNGSLMSVPDVRKRIKSIQQRGGQFVTIDPRKTETADISDQHHFITPGSDALFLMGIIHTLFRKNLIDLGRAESFTQGVNMLRNMVTGFTPEKVAPHTGISAKAIRNIATDLAKAERACCYGRMGTSTQEFGGLSSWLIMVINIITGNMDEEGGMMFTHPAIDLAGLSNLFGQTGTFNSRKSRVSRLPEFGGEYPASTMAEEMLTQGEGQIRGLITHAGNPVLSTPNGKQLEKGLEGLEFMVAIDFYLNETTQHADIILPPTGPLEHSHYDLALNMMTIRNTAKYSPPLFNPAPDTRHDWQILLELTKRFESKSPISWAGAEIKHKLLNRLGADGVLDVLLRSGPYGTKVPQFAAQQKQLVDLLYNRLPKKSIGRLALELSPYNKTHKHRSSQLNLRTLKKHPHGIDLGPLKSSLPQRLATLNHQINLVPKLFLKDVSRLQERLASKPPSRTPETFLMIGRRHVRSNNSWLHNSYRLVKGKNRCTALIHPGDAKRLNIRNGDMIIVSSKTGEIRLPVEVTENIMPSVISIPHGWGHSRKGSQLAVASEHPGVSINDITDEKLIDELTGAAALSGQPVTVSRIEVKNNIVRLNDVRLATITE
ncbi:dehydrogenase [Gammaproteobacteria bacterium 45_16_T64]|nr:dehydrogenase [Gammaproteobacteria bacterium 45_16_T64]